MSVQLIGVKELYQCFAGLPRQVSEPILQKIHAKAAIPAVNRIHRLAPVGKTGNLAESIGIVKAGKKNVGELGAINIGPRRKGGFKGFAGHLNEYGTRKRSTKKGANRGQMKAKPFEAPAWEQTDTQVENNIEKELKNVLEGYIRKTVKK